VLKGNDMPKLTKPDYYRIKKTIKPVCDPKSPPNVESVIKGEIAMEHIDQNEDSITVSWYENLSKKTRREINYLIGLMNLSEPEEYDDLADFLRTVRDRVITSKSFMRQAINVLDRGI
jgi:hypothetical protein